MKKISLILSIATFVGVIILSILFSNKVTSVQRANFTEKLDPNLSINVQYDYDNRVRTGTVVPAFIEIKNTGGAIDAEVCIISQGEYAESILYKTPVHISENGTTNAVVPFFVSTDGSTINIRAQLIKNDEIIALPDKAKTKPAFVSTKIVGVFSDDEASAMYWTSRKSLKGEYGNDVNVSTIKLTEDNFPDKFYYMDRFSLIVLNHFDIQRLTQDQQKVLVDWVKSGGHILVDADKSNSHVLKSLSELIDIEVTGSKDLASAWSETEVTQLEIKDVGIVEPQGKILLGNETPFVMSYPAENGKVFVTTFSLGNAEGAKVLFDVQGLPYVGWQGNAQDYYYRSMRGFGYESYSMENAIRGISWIDAPSLSLMAITLLIFILIVGPINYHILAKKDKRDLIWITAPVLSMLCCGLVISYGLIKNGSEAISSVVTIVDFSDKSSNLIYSGVGIGFPKKSSYDVLINEDAFALTDESYGYYYGYDDEEFSYAKPKIMFEVGSYPKVVFPEQTQWDMGTFRLIRDIEVGDSVDAKIFYEGNKEFYTVKNNCNVDLEDVTIVSSQGYIRIPFLEKGEERTGELTEFPESSRSSYYFDYYRVISEIYGFYDYYYYYDERPEQQDRTDEQKREDYMKSQIVQTLLSGDRQNIHSAAQPVFVWGWSGEVGNLELQVNNKSVKNELNLAIIFDNGKPGFENNGTITIPHGYITGTVSETTTNEVYIGDMYAHFNSGEVTFRFDVPDEALQYTIEDMEIETLYYSGNFDSFLFNFDTGNWDSYSINKKVGNTPADVYIADDGEILLKVTTLIESDDEDEEIERDFSRYVSLENLSVSILGKAGK